MEILVVFLLLGLVLAFVGGNLWQNKGGSFAVGFLIVFFLGLIGLLIVALVNPSATQALAPASGPRATRECPHCKEAMRRDARVCPHCRMEREPWPFEE